MPWLIASIAFVGWLLSLYASFFLGYKYRDIRDKIADIQVELKKKVVKKDAEPKRSSVIDPSDIVQQAQFEMDEMSRRLNQ